MEVSPNDPAPGATSVRLRKRSIRGRVKAVLPIQFTQEKLTAHAGLELFRRFLEGSGITKQLESVGAELDAEHRRRHNPTRT